MKLPGIAEQNRIAAHVGAASPNSEAFAAARQRVENGTRFTPHSDMSGKLFPKGPSSGGGAKFEVPDRQSSPYPDAPDAEIGNPNLSVDEMVDRAWNHLDAAAEEGDHVPRHERLRKAGALLTRASEKLQPKSAGAQHLRW